MLYMWEKLEKGTKRSPYLEEPPVKRHHSINTPVKEHLNIHTPMKEHLSILVPVEGLMLQDHPQQDHSTNEEDQEQDHGIKEEI